MANKNGFQIETTVDGIPLTRNIVEGLDLKCVQGLCAADLDQLDQPRDFDWYMTNVIAPLVESGEVSDGSDGPFDDRKLRLDQITLSGEGLQIALGATHYGAFRKDIDRDETGNENLQAIGSASFGDRYALFSRAPGVAVIVVSSNGAAYLGERTNEEDKGLLNAVAGHLKYRAPENVNLREDAVRELEEEFGIEESDIVSLEFVGLYSNLNRGDSDFTFIADVAQPDEYFTSGAWKEKVHEREHKDLIQLASLEQTWSLLNTGKIAGYDEPFRMMYSTRGGLESLKPGELRD